MLVFRALQMGLCQHLTIFVAIYAVGLVLTVIGLLYEYTQLIPSAQKLQWFWIAFIYTLLVGILLTTLSVIACRQTKPVQEDEEPPPSTTAQSALNVIHIAAIFLMIILILFSWFAQ